MKHYSNVLLLSLLLCFGMQMRLLADDSIGGSWDGALSVMGTDLGIRVQFTTNGTATLGTIDIPEQGAHGIPLTNLSYHAPQVHFELPAGPGLAVFDGTLKESEISGKFQQAGAQGVFHLKRAAAAEKPAASEPLPYLENEVHFVNGDITFAGTLTLPRSTGKHPAIIMITGSGSQNRDEELFGFKPFRIIADSLTRRGIAVLRYDDRGVGGSTGSPELATTEDFVGDALAAVQFLKGREEIDSHHIGLCGHSEGGIVAPMAAARSKDIAFIILLSGSGVTGEKIMLEQAELIEKATGASDAAIAGEAALQKRMFEAVRTGQGWDQLKESIRKLTLAGINELPPDQRKAITDPDQYAGIQAEAQLKMAQSPWLKFFLDFDPASALEKVSCPVLALFGELDLQVPAGSNKAAMEAALKRGHNPDYTLKVLPKANHLYQSAHNGSPMEYSTLEKNFVPGFLDLLADWVEQRVKVRG